jgi:cytochrome c oxidase cbb3-type subunit 3/ubiquinol-cytochrome c reductase cytochrome c subunit
MRRDHALLASLSIAACVAGGAVECSYHATTEVERHGGEVYARMCSVCHGAAGEGYKADDAPAIAHPDFLASASDAFLRDSIVNGRQGTTMSAWGVERGGPLVRSDVDAVIAFMRAWDDKPRAKLDERPLAGDTLRGQLAYAGACGPCHGPRGVGGKAVHIGDSGLLSSASNGFLRYAIHRGRSGTAMPAFDGSNLDDAAIEDVVTVLRSWQSQPSSTPRPPPAKPPPLPLGPVPLNPKGPEPIGFKSQPATTGADVIKAQLDRGARMAILDARAPSDYAREHIAGAVSVPFYDPDPYVADLPKDAWLVCYCACPHAESGQLAVKLVNKGMKKVTVLDEGLGVWKNRGYGTHTGIDP